MGKKTLCKSNKCREQVKQLKTITIYGVPDEKLKNCREERGKNYLIKTAGKK
jgi:hypothetical protein